VNEAHAYWSRVNASVFEDSTGVLVASTHRFRAGSA